MKHVSAAASEHDAVLVAFSCGADSIAALDVCARYFKRVALVHWWVLPQFSAHEKILDYYCARYNARCYQYPSYTIARAINRRMGLKLPVCTQADIIRQAREESGIRLVAYGYKIGDSIVRLAIVKACKGYNRESALLYPIAQFTKESRNRYIRDNKLPLPLTYEHGMRDFSALEDDAVLWLYNNCPDDYARAKRVYPWLDEIVYKAQHAIN